MAVVTVKSAAITNRDAVPSVINSRSGGGGDIKHARGEAVITSGDSIASKYLVCSIPSNAVPISVRLSAPDIGTTTVADIGLYKSTQNGGAVVDADFFGSAVVLNAGALSKVEQIFESGVITIANAMKRIWEHLALSADPNLTYDVVLTLTGAADATGTVMVEIDYTI